MGSHTAFRRGGLIGSYMVGLLPERYTAARSAFLKLKRCRSGIAHGKGHRTRAAGGFVWGRGLGRTSSPRRAHRRRHNSAQIGRPPPQKVHPQRGADDDKLWGRGKIQKADDLVTPEAHSGWIDEPGTLVLLVMSQHGFPGKRTAPVAKLSQNSSSSAETLPAMKDL